MADFGSLPIRERMRLIAERARRDGDVETLRELEAAERLLGANPLQGFEPHSEAQYRFFTATTDIVAAFAGNQFGKSTALICRALRELCSRGVLPAFLAETKLYEPPVHGWIVVPTNDKIFDPGGFLDVIQKWVPVQELKSGKWEGSWSKERKTLHFKNGSSLGFKTYEQDPSTLGGASLHFIGYDEPPPIRTRNECLMRLVRYGGFEMFAMTPIRANTGWVKRDIYRNREAPHITVVRGSIHDNPTLDARKREMILAQYPDDERRAREFGDFMEFGGLMYPDFDRCVLRESDPRVVARDGRFTFDPEFVQSLDIVVGIDPGIRNAGFSWVGFDRDLTAHLFEEGVLQDKHASDYVAFIREQNSRWGIRADRVSYVIDPAAKQRAQANGMTVLSEVNKAGIYPNLGQNDHQLGFGQMRGRMQKRRLLVGPNCVLHRAQADNYAAKEPEEGKDDSHLEPIETNAHCLASLRYACMERFWDPVMEAEAPKRNLGYVPNGAPDLSGFSFPGGSEAPMGAMS